MRHFIGSYLMGAVRRPRQRRAESPPIRRQIWTHHLE